MNLPYSQEYRRRKDQRAPHNLACPIDHSCKPSTARYFNQRSWNEDFQVHFIRPTKVETSLPKKDPTLAHQNYLGIKGKSSNYGYLA
jgi:hypothetical protein